MMELPVIDLEPYLLANERFSKSSESSIVNGSGDGNHDAENCNLDELCKRVADSLRETGALVIRDPRCSIEDNDRFLDMMERYWSKPSEFKRKQERPELHYQVGVTPEGVETPRCILDENLRRRMLALSEDARPLMPTGADPKWRYMWRAGPRPSTTRFQELNAEPVIPDEFPDWVTTMNGWGQKMISAVEVVAEMAAIGFGLPQKAFTSLMSQGPHLLAPTGSDLSKYGKKGTVFAGYHYDLNFLTIHGRSRFPGLFIWLKNGRKVAVSVPPGCLLLQAGKELEWLTGGECLAGMHEVVVSDRTVAAIEAAHEVGRTLWRVSSTLFSHIASDAMLQPLGHFINAPRAQEYKPMLAGDYVKSELAIIKLGKRPQGVESVSVADGTSI